MKVSPFLEFGELALLSSPVPAMGEACLAGATYQMALASPSRRRDDAEVRQCVYIYMFCIDLHSPRVLAAHLFFICSVGAACTCSTISSPQEILIVGTAVVVSYLLGSSLKKLHIIICLLSTTVVKKSLSLKASPSRGISSKIVRVHWSIDPMGYPTKAICTTGWEGHYGLCGKGNVK